MPKIKQSEEERRESNRQRSRKYQRKLRLENPDLVKEQKRKEWIKFRDTRTSEEAQKFNEKRRERRMQRNALYPEKAKEENRRVALRWKQRHPESGTRQNPNITEEKRLKVLSNLTFRFPKGHTINNGVPSKLRGRKRDPEVVKRIAAKQRGRKKGRASEETRRKMSDAQKKRHEGGVRISRESHLIRSGIEIKIWREAVFRRDDYTCQGCGKRGVTLQADHIKPFAYFPESRFDIENGRTLCAPCHRKTDTYGEGAKRLAKGLNLTRADTFHLSQAMVRKDIDSIESFRDLLDQARHANIKDDDIFRRNLRQAQELLELSGLRIANALRVSGPTVSRWIGGSNLPHIAMRKSVCAWIVTEIDKKIKRIEEVAKEASAASGLLSNSPADEFSPGVR